MRRLVAYARTMRQRPTDAEALLWRHLRAGQLGAKFRRQHPVAGYIVDFYCVSAKLAVELDGGDHNTPSQRAYDERRRVVLNRHGIHVLRLWNHEVLTRPEAAVEHIAHHLEAAAAKRANC